MKRLLTIVALALFTFSGIYIAQLHTQFHNHYETLPEIQAQQWILNKTIHNVMRFDEEVLPLIELPTIEIIEKRNKTPFIQTKILDDDVLPLIIMDEIIITPNSNLNIS